MTRVITERLWQALIVLLLVSLITFVLIRSAPGGPAILLDPSMTPEDRAKVAASLGLDDPLPVQYVKWITSTLRGDLGRSLMKKQPVAEMIAERLPATLELALAGLLLTIVVGIPLGVAAATRLNTAWDRVITVGATVGIAMPGFWFGIMLIIVFSVELGWLPSAGRTTIGLEGDFLSRLRHLVLPSLVIATFSLAQITQFTRSSMLEVLGQDYVRTARAKGLAQRAVMYRHALRNALIPVVTVLGLMLPRLVGGAVITETIFAWPGMGRLATDAAFQRDYPVTMGITMVVSIMVILSNLITDLAYTVIDPRIRLTK